MTEVPEKDRDDRTGASHRPCPWNCWEASSVPVLSHRSDKFVRVETKPISTYHRKRENSGATAPAERSGRNAGACPPTRQLERQREDRPGRPRTPAVAVRSRGGCGAVLDCHRLTVRDVRNRRKERQLVERRQSVGDAPLRNWGGGGE